MAPLALPEPPGYYAVNRGKPPALSFSPDKFQLQTAAAYASTALDLGTDNPQAEVSHGLPLPLAKSDTRVLP